MTTPETEQEPPVQPISQPPAQQPAESPEGAGAGGPADPAPRVEIERRAFVRRMTTDAVGAAGRVFGLSRAVTRGVVAAGQAVRDELGGALAEAEFESPVMATVDAPAVAAPDVAAPDLAGPDVAAPAVAVPAVATPEPTPPGATPVSAAQPVVRLTEAQQAVLRGARSAIVAVNGRDAPPLAVPVSIHWDGETIRFPSLGWSRRSAAIRSDPRVTLVVEEAGSDRYLVLEGVAEFVTGNGIRDAMLPLLSRDGDASEADARWSALVAADVDRVVVIVRPTKVLPGRSS